MGSEWKETTLGEVINFRRGHDLPKTKMIPGEFPVIGSNGIIGYHNEFTTKTPCVSVGRSGNVGNPFMIKKDCWSHNTTLYIDDFKGNSPEYIFYFLKTLNLKNLGGGSAVPTLNRNHIHPLEVKLPPLPEQKSIAHILGSLDDKIELNRQMNQTLEQMAQALFKSWFVDFDPVIDNALAVGNEIPEPLQKRANLRHALGTKRKPLPAEIQQLFPVSFTYSEELDKWMPKGWKYMNLDKVTNKITDGTHSTVIDDIKGEFHLLSCKNIKNGQINIDNKDRRINKETLEFLRKRTQLTKGDLLITTVGTIGEVALIRQDEIPWELQRSVAIIRPDNRLIFPEYLYQLSKTNDFQHQALARSEGSVQTCLFLGAIREIDFVLPPEELIKKFEKYASSYYHKIEGTNKQTRYLAKLRDTLLPRLVSGEVRVPEETLTE